MRENRAGFTLLEIMIAIAFIGVALLAVISAQGRGIKLSEEVRYSSTAIFLARGILTETQLSGDLSSERANDQFEEPFEQFSWTREITPFFAMSGLYKIRVRVHRTGKPPGEGLILDGLIYQGGS